MTNKKLSINQVAKLCGITVRTLHYYDEINLLSPSSIASNGYRQYSEGDLLKLQEILFFKELDVPLKEIKMIMDSPGYNKRKALKRHKEMLILKRDRLDKIISLVNDNLNDDKINLKEFDMTEINKHIEKYKEEVKQRWGDSVAYKQSAKKTFKYSENEWQKINAERDEIFADFAKCMNIDKDCKEADTLVTEWQNHISKYFYDCTDEILSGLADMYVYDERFKQNMDKHSDGLAEFISNSIKNYLNSK